jgi:hypothetical protein
MSRIDAGIRGVPRAPAGEDQGGAPSGASPRRRGRRARGEEAPVGRRREAAGRSAQGGGRDEVAGLTPFSVGVGVAGVVTGVGLVLSARGDITLAPILLVLAYLVLFPLALTR